ncbi:MAG: hypothetical protein N3B13_04095 [Deltaproteobacteria bacterium]|nr:hypothetical protein [Deltaproteobacteria bacterium]
MIVKSLAVLVISYLKFMPPVLRDRNQSGASYLSGRRRSVKKVEKW